MRNIHIHPSPLLNASRILKETKSLLQHTAINEVLLVGMAGQGLPHEEVLSDRLTLYRLSPGKDSANGWMKIARYFLWYLRILKFCFTHRPDVVNCHTLWVLPIGVMIKILIRCKLVYDAHELETEAVGEATSFRKFLSQMIERLCMYGVDLLIVVSPGIETWYRRRYGNKIKAVTILNTPSFQAPQHSKLLSEALGLAKDEKILLYQGMLGAGRGIEHLLKAASALKKAGYSLVFMGYGDDHWIEQIRQYSERGLCYLHPAVPPGVLLKYTASADFGVLWIDDNCLSYHLCLPNKLFEYLMAGIPVLMPDLPEIRKILDKRNIGVCVNNFDPENVITSLEHLQSLQRSSEFLEQLENFNQTFNWEKEEKKMVQAYNQYVFSD